MKTPPGTPAWFTQWIEQKYEDAVQSICVASTESSLPERAGYLIAIRDLRDEIETMAESETLDRKAHLEVVHART